MDEQGTGSSASHPDYLKNNLACTGRIGRRREQYCIEQLRYMKVCHARIREDQEKYAMEKKAAISCGKGCSYCCYLYIGASLQECEAIAYHLVRNETSLQRFLSGYPSWREKVSAGGDRFLECQTMFNRMIAERGGNNDSLDLALFSHNKQQIPCPFLDGGLCSMYDARPANCAGLFVTRPPEYCRPGGPRPPRFNLTSIDDVMFDTTFYYRKLLRPATLYMPVAVYRILTEGYAYLSGFAGLEDIEKDFLAGLDEPDAGVPNTKTS
jgi:Fe-S-cluster containining protein